MIFYCIDGEENKNTFSKDEYESLLDTLNKLDSKRSLLRKRNLKFNLGEVCEIDISYDAVCSYPTSLFYIFFIDLDSRSRPNVIDVDFHLRYYKEIAEYMEGKNETFLSMSIDELDQFCRELIIMNFSFSHELFDRIYTSDAQYGIAWKHSGIWNVSNQKHYPLTLQICSLKIEDLIFNEENTRIQVDVNIENEREIMVLEDLWRFVQHKTFEKNPSITIEPIEELAERIHIDQKEALFQQYLSYYTSLFCRMSRILTSTEYDKYLEEWVPEQYEWRRIYRASEHQFSSLAFHSLCDEQGPTIMLIKSVENDCIFGGYATLSWRLCMSLNHCRKSLVKAQDPSESFIFTLSNPHNVQPTKFCRKKGSSYGIICLSSSGPIFGYKTEDIRISGYCTKRNSCYIMCDDRCGYERHPQYKSALYVNTGAPDEKNFFTVWDYEVYGIDYKNKSNIEKMCKNSDLIWNYIQTGDIPSETLQSFEDDDDLVMDLDRIHNTDRKIRLKISHLCFHDSSMVLPESLIVKKDYDGVLRQWLGSLFNWKLIYRASEHDYTAKSFHEFCDDKGPTVVVVKSTERWVFGGYTTRSWKSKYINNKHTNSIEYH